MEICLTCKLPLKLRMLFDTPRILIVSPKVYCFGKSFDGLCTQRHQTVCRRLKMGYVALHFNIRYKLSLATRKKPSLVSWSQSQFSAIQVSLASVLNLALRQIRV